MNSNRKPAFKAVVGSHSYNLNREESDIDYKMFVYPSFEDLYKGNMYSHQTNSATEDIDVHDIRKLPNLFFKSNINFIEVLYSRQYTFYGRISLGWLLTCKRDLVKMNLPYLFSACIGMHHNKMRLLEKGTEGTQHLVKKFGYDTKQALHAYRVLDFLERFYATNFEDFDWAIRYREDEPQRQWLLGIKDGAYTLEEFRRIAEARRTAVITQLEQVYKSKEPDLKLKEELDNFIMLAVRESLI